MQISETRIRQIIREEIESAQTYNRVIPALRSVMTYAETFVESVLDGSRDGEAAEALTDAVQDLNLIVKLLQRARAPEASNMALFSRLATELAAKSGFWKTPAFIGRDGHGKELATQLARLKKVAKTIASSISASRNTAHSVA